MGRSHKKVPSIKATKEKEATENYKKAIFKAWRNALREQGLIDNTTRN